MDESREQQRPAPPPPPAYIVQQPVYYAPAAPAARPGRWLKFRRAMRLLLRRFLYGMVLLGRAMRPFAVFIVIIMAQLVVIGWLGFLLWGPKGGQPEFRRADSLPPSPAIEQFIAGQQKFDADLMWDAFSPEYQAAQLQRGASKETLQAEIDNQRLMGLHYLKYDYIGGVKLDDGGGMYFYAVDVEVPSQRVKLPFVFIADDEGKIVRINSPLNN